jgi:hypothetical protein
MQTGKHRKQIRECQRAGQAGSQKSDREDFYFAAAHPAQCVKREQYGKHQSSESQAWSCHASSIGAYDCVGAALYIYNPSCMRAQISSMGVADSVSSGL